MSYVNGTLFGLGYKSEKTLVRRWLTFHAPAECPHKPLGAAIAAPDPLFLMKLRHANLIHLF